MNAYEECIKCMENNNDIDIVNFDIYEEEANNKTYIQTCHEKYIIDYNIEINKLPMVSVWNKIIKLDILLNNKIYFKENSKFEDTEFWYRLNVLLDLKLLYIQKPFYVYRQHEQSMSKTYNNKYLQQYNVLYDLYEFIKKHNKEEKFKNLMIKYAKLDRESLEQRPKDFKKQFIQSNIEYIKKINIKGEDVKKYLDFTFFSSYIEDEYIRKLYMESINDYKKIDYKIMNPNKIAFKIKREIVRIIEQISKILK